MVQRLFGTDTDPDLPDLDLNFSELYAFWNPLNITNLALPAVGNGGYIGFGAYFDLGSVTWKNTVSSQGGMTFRNASGDIQIQGDVSPGAAGTNFAAFVERWRFKNNGPLLGNRTSQQSGGYLELSGNIAFQPAAAAPTLGVNGDMSFQLVSNTSLKILVRGSDGVTRSTTLTLA